MAAQHAKYMKSPNPNLLLVISEEDVRVWYGLIFGLDPPFKGGEYLFQLTAPDDFPARPPRFEMLTKNGVFVPGGAICISIGEFHADNAPGQDGSHGWRAALGMAGFAEQVVNGLIAHDGLGGGVRIQILPDALKKTLAVGSRARNQQMYPAISAAFDSLAAQFPESVSVRTLYAARGLPAPASAKSAPTVIRGIGPMPVGPGAGSAGPHVLPPRPGEYTLRAAERHAHNVRMSQAEQPRAETVAGSRLAEFAPAAAARVERGLSVPAPGPATATDRLAPRLADSNGGIACPPAAVPEPPPADSPEPRAALSPRGEAARTDADEELLAITLSLALLDSSDSPAPEVETETASPAPAEPRRERDEPPSESTRLPVPREGAFAAAASRPEEPTFEPTKPPLEPDRARGESGQTVLSAADFDALMEDLFG